MGRSQEIFIDCETANKHTCSLKKFETKQMSCFANANHVSIYESSDTKLACGLKSYSIRFIMQLYDKTIKSCSFP